MASLPISSITPMKPSRILADSSFSLPMLSHAPIFTEHLAGSQTQWGGDILLVKKDNLHIDIIAILVQKVLQEVGNTLQGDVSTDHNVPNGRGQLEAAGTVKTQEPTPGKTGKRAAAGKHPLALSSPQAPNPLPSG